MPEVSALIWVSYASLFILSLLDNIRGPFFPEILADMNLTGTSGSAFFAVTSLFAFIGSWSSHRILARISAKTLLCGSSLILAIGFGLIAKIHAFSLLLVACALFGFGYGALNLAQNVIIFEAGKPHLRRRLFAGLHSMYGLAALVAPIVASLFRHFGFSWRECFFILAATPLLAVAVSFELRPKTKKVAVVRAHMNAQQWRVCGIFALTMAGYLWGEISASTRLVQWVRLERGFSPDSANLLLGGFFLTLVSGRVLFSSGFVSRFDNWMILRASAALSAVFYFLSLQFSPLWMVAAGLSMAPFFPVAMEQISDHFHSKSSHALGFVLGFGSLSIVVMHVWVGWLTDQMGITHALHVGPGALVAVALALKFLPGVLAEARRAESKSP